MNTALQPPAEVLKIARTLEKAGFETWCVGGAVRDALLVGERHLDWDLATAAHPQQIRGLFARTIPVGIEFGTVGVLDATDVMHEVTTFRRDVHTDGRHAVVEFGASLEEDLARRDLTINAIAYSPSTGEVRDPFEGRADLVRRIIRAVGEPAERLREDRLRGLRAIRFAARFGFGIDPATWEAIVGSSEHLTRLSAERVKQEIEKTMEQVELPASAFRLWRDSGSLGALIPEIGAITNLQLAALDYLKIPIRNARPGRKIARLTGLFSSAPPDAVLAILRRRKIARLTGLFSSAPPDDVLAILRRLRFSNADAAWISSIVGRWSAIEAEMRLTLQSAEAPRDAVLRRWAAIAGRTRLASVLRLADAHWRAERDAGIPAPSGQSVASAYRRAIRIAYRDPIEVSDLAINGRDLERIGITGPRVGETLRSLLESVIYDPAANSAATLLEMARKQIAATLTKD